MASEPGSINGYIPISRQQISGQSTWFFAKQNDGNALYFIKKFLSPKKPNDGSLGDNAFKEKMHGRFLKFVEHHAQLSSIVNVDKSYLLPFIDQFEYGGFYYKVSNKFSELDVALSEIAILDDRLKIGILLNISCAIQILHRSGYVHSDIKLDNILFTYEYGIEKPFVIDYDGAFIDGRACDVDEIYYDQNYASPELVDYSRTGNRTNLSKAIDIFALGILFHEVWYGHSPQHTGKCCSLGEAVIDGSGIIFSGNCHFSRLVGRMLSRYSEKRPEIDEVCASLLEIDRELDSVKLKISRFIRTHILNKPATKVVIRLKKALPEPYSPSSPKKKVRKIGLEGKLKTTLPD